jgi:molybdate transport system substrate-binding protein
MKKLLVLTLAGLMSLPSWAEDVYVAAAASLTDVMKAVEPLYVKTHPGTRLVFVYGATGMLRTQVLKGAPCDVFVGADRWFGGASSNMAEVVKVESVRIVAANTLVAVAGKNSVPKGDTLAAWLGGAKKIGIGNPASVPVGRYTKKLLESEKVWDASSPKFVQGTNVREVLLWLRQGAVDIGFVYGSDLVAVKDPSLKTLAEYATPGGTAIELAGGVAKNARDPEAALQFLVYLKSPEAAKVFKELGFVPR